MTSARLSVCFFLLAFSQFACGESHFVVNSNDRQQEPAKPSVQVHSTALQRLLDSPSISPYEMANYIKESAESDEEFIDFKPIWERLNNLKIEDDSLSEEEKEIFDGFKPSFTRWQAELIEIPDSYHQINRVVVKIMIYGGSYRRFLIFKQEHTATQRSDWTFIDHFDISFPKPNPDAQQFHHLHVNDIGSWLILRNGGGYGTGVSGEHEMWYKIDAEPPRTVLCYSMALLHKSKWKRIPSRNAVT